MDKEETLLEGMPPEYYDDVSVQIRSFHISLAFFIYFISGFLPSFRIITV